jgi:hypothetical protein
MHSAAAKRDEARWDETGTPEREDGKQNNQDGAGRSSVDGDDEHPYGLYATREVEKDDVEMMLEALLRGDSGDLKAWQADFSKASVADSNNSQSRGHATGLVGSMKEADVEKMQSNLGETRQTSFLGTRHTPCSTARGAHVERRGKQKTKSIAV